MKYLNFLAFTVVGWPALIVGYLWASAVSGFKTGMHMQDRHEDVAIAAFVKPTDGVSGTGDKTGGPTA